ncbi:MAG TPA: valine--tRNA ligase [Gemmatimonadaceae bacterium]|nr:valine--tRNA ligase [Gemmatimonadaceae bacterium]
MASPTTTDLPDRYDPAGTEAEIYRRWRDAGAFGADAAASTRAGGDRDPFTLVMPPPNVTAVLHVGHGLNNTVQDVIARWARMQAGTEALWVPGTDHAGIATQNVIEKQLAAEGRTRFDVGRDAFLARTEAFVARTGGTILEQLAALGCSADWSRTAYTFSPELSRGVREAFVRLFEDGLIYRGYRVIHWCPRCLTSLSDEEAEFQEETGTLYHVAYPVSGHPSRAVVVATTRPETMLGDVAVAVNPADDRYRDLVGRSVRLPILDRDIPVIADEYADPAFGTGVVKITPAHDANDFEVGRRHGLPMPVVIDETARMREVKDADGRVPAWLAGLDRFEARARIVDALQASGALVKTETHTHNVRHCYRCDTVVEPRLSDQWFVKMAPLAQPALEAVRTGAIRILPERWEAVYVNWLTNIRDWNISRQLWWGHRVPVWYCDECDPPNTFASRDDLAACPNCGCAVRQDEDVLDTWFSSWLWPLSTLGWPDEQAPDLKAFYPTDVLVTAPEILFFWVARMIMAGYQFAGRSPFHTVLLHGTVRDTNHVKMSKSLGNGIDPLDVIRLYGADALRWTLISGMGLGADVILDPNDLDKSFATGRNFATKLWNIGRFLLSNVGDAPVPALESLPADRLTRADAWILGRLDAAIAECDAALGPLRPTTAAAGADGVAWRPEQRAQGMRLNEYAETARRFVWSELADWYVEAIKGRLAEGGADGEVARAVLVHAFDMALRLLHPIVPFITESIWQRLPSRGADALLMRAAWPARVGAPAQPAREFDLARDAVAALRQMRSEYAVPPGKRLDAVAVPAPARDGVDPAVVLEQERAVIDRLARVSLTVAGAAPEGAAAHAILADGSALVVPLAGLIDVDKECARLRADLAGLDKQIAALAGRLANEAFTAKAPPAVVQSERDKLLDWTTRQAQLRAKVEALCAG